MKKDDQAVGKRVRGSLYVHRDAVAHLPAFLHTRVRDAAAHPDATAWSVARLDDAAPDAVTLLDYEPFGQAAFPALRRSHRVMPDGTVTIRRFGAENPPILHRKELMLAPEDPRRPGFAALTAMLEAKGLFRDMARRGRRQPWNAALLDAGLRIAGAGVLPIDPTIPRHKTAIARRSLSKPVALAISHGLLRPGMTVLDYGCGRGDDVRALQAQGYEAIGWDPHYRPDTALLHHCDVVILGYVLNVIEDAEERVQVLRKARAHARHSLIVAVPPPGRNPHVTYNPYRDGRLSHRQTFQREFTDADLRTLVEQALGMPSHRLTAGCHTIPGFVEGSSRSGAINV